MVVGDAIAGFIWATRRGEEETSFTPFAFSRSRFLCAGTMVLGRGHGKALRRAWDTYFWLLHFVFWYFLLCVHEDEGTGEFSSYSSLVMKFMLFINLMLWLYPRDLRLVTCDLVGFKSLHCPDIAASAGMQLTQDEKSKVSNHTLLLRSRFQENLIRIK